MIRDNGEGRLARGGGGDARAGGGEGGWGPAALGILLHFVIAFRVAAVYWLLSRNISFLTSHSFASGLIYGAAVHFAMQYVVIPLSAIGWRTAPFDPSPSSTTSSGTPFSSGCRWR